MISFFTHPAFLLTIGGAAGTNARYWLGQWIASHKWTEHFPLAIFIINVSGSLVLGLLYVPFHNRLPSWYLLLGVGFCGGYTTFSTFALETVELIRRHYYGLAFLNVAGSVAAACLVTWLALAAMRTIDPPETPPPITGGADRETQTAPQTPPPDSASDT